MKDLLESWRLRRAARRVFGWSRLRPAQLRAMRALRRGRDALVVLPTGAGKSAVYQVPAVLAPGPTFVISPLLALQQDQIAGLNARPRAERTRAVRISSAETPAQQQAALDEVRAGRARFLFLTPEQLARPDRLAQLRDLRPSLVAVDEAHCLSAWGYDFRPDYLILGRALAELAPTVGRHSRRRRRPAVVALTATASPPVREDIAARLGLSRPEVVVTGLDRPNLYLEASHCPTEEHRWRRLLALLSEQDGDAGIVYVPTRRAAREVAARLTEAGYRARHYHGGLAGGARTRLHEEFLAGQVPVMVATSAFGMGIDKPDIRWVAHLALPDSPDSYLQEIGRAGRDGEPARALLLFRAEDVALQRYFSSGLPSEVEIRDLVAVLRERPRSRAELRELSGFGARKLTGLVSLLAEVGALVEGPDARLSSPPHAPVPVETARLALAEVARHQRVQATRIDMMRQFAESRSCRGQALLAYFGDRLDGPCGHCDNCAPRPAGDATPTNGGGSQPALAARPALVRARSGTATRRPRIPAPRRSPERGAGRVPTPAKLALDAGLAGRGAGAADLAGRGAGASGPGRPYPPHSVVRHRRWGIGTVLGYDDDRMTVLFDTVGYKTLSVAVVVRGNLLTSVDG